MSTVVSPSPSRPLPSSSAHTSAQPVTRRSSSRSASRRFSEKGKGPEISLSRTYEDDDGGVPEQISAPSSPTTPAVGDSAWGAHFWVTLVDPQTGTEFYACPSTGECSWDPPVGNFVLPRSVDGEWWELADESRGGIPYYYHTQTGETVWTRPDAFVIPLAVIQTSALGRRLSQTAPTRRSNADMDATERPANRRSRSYTDTRTIPEEPRSLDGLTRTRSTQARRSVSSEHQGPLSKTWANGNALPAIPGSPAATSNESGHSKKNKEPATPPRKVSGGSAPSQNGQRSTPPAAGGRPRAGTQVSFQSPGSLNAAAEFLAQPSPVNRSLDFGNVSAPSSPTRGTQLQVVTDVNSPTSDKFSPPSPRRPIPALPSQNEKAAPRQRKNTNASVKDIGRPILDPDATRRMSPMKSNLGRPIFVKSKVQAPLQTKRLSTGDHLTLPADLAQDIQQFAVSDFAKRYFSTHRTGLIFRRRVPVERMMVWQKQPLNSPLLVLNRSLHKDAVKIFKVIQRIMGDRERDRPVGIRVPSDFTSSIPSSRESSQGHGSSNQGLLEEERWLLNEGIAHGELRDEIYCQLVKQLTENPTPESIFRGWQFLCVLIVTFPPSKNLEDYLRSFMRSRLSHSEGRIDVMAKYCITKLSVIAKKGPRGKAPTLQEIENAADAAFNPSTFGESLAAVFRLQQRSYADSKIPIVLPFLADGILALGGTKAEGIFRVPGDSDVVSELKSRIDQGRYNLDGIDDPHVLASLFKLWLRELQDPLVPEELYNDCIDCAEDPEMVVSMVGRLPTINRRVVLFVVSFMQLFLEEKIQSVTKMTSANLALVMAPNLLRCSSESIAVVFTNAKFEHIFVHNLFLHLRVNQVDPDYTPVHGLGSTGQPPRMSKPRAKRGT